MNTLLQDIIKQIINDQRLYKSVRLINGNLIVVLNDNVVLNKVEALEDDYNAVLNASTISEIKELMGISETEDKEDTKTASMKEMKKSISKRIVKF